MPQDPTGQLPQDQEAEYSLEEFEEKARERYGIPKPLWHSLAQQESGGDVNAVSPTNVTGKWQVTKKTAAAYNLDTSDSFQQAVAAAKNLREGYDRYKDQFADDNQRWLAASAYYYRGPSAVKADGTFEETSADGLSTAADYVTSIAKRWKSYNDGQAGSTPAQSQPSQAEQLSQGLLPGVKAPTSRPQTGQERRRASDEVARRNAAPAIARLVADVESLKREGNMESAQRVAAQIKQRFGKWMEVGEDGAIRSKVPGWNPVQPKAGPYTPTIEEDRARRQAEFVQKPLLEQYKDRALDALSAGGGQVSRMARQATVAGTALNRKLGLPAPQDDAALETWRQGEERRMSDIRERQAGRPKSFASDVAEGIIEGVPAAGAAIGGTMLTGGGLPAAALIGGGMGAAGADWDNPARALTQTAINAVAPIAGGKIGSKIGGAVASRLANPTARAVSAAGGELAGGAAGSVLGSGAQQLAFEGRIDPRELAKEAVIGVAMNAPGAVGAGRAARTARPVAEAPTITPDTAIAPGVRIFRQGEQIPARQRNERQIAIDIAKPDGSVETVMAIAPRGMNESQIRAAAEQAAKPAGGQAQGQTFDDVINDSQARIAQSLAAGDTNAVDIELSVLDQSIKDQYNDAVKAAKGNPAARAAAQRVRAQQARIADGLKRQVDTRRNELQQPTEPLEQLPSDPTAELTTLIANAPDTQQFRAANGAIMAGPSSLPSRRLLPPAPSAPETQQIPGVPRTIQASDEPTGRFQTGRLPMAAENAPTAALPQAQRRTATLPRSPRAPEQPQAAAVPRVAPDILSATQEPTNRISEGVGDELQRYSKPLSGQPVELPRPMPRAPRATAENIERLRNRYADLDRIANDRRGSFTGDLRDEMRELGSVIADYDNQQGRRGGRFSPDAEPGYIQQRPEPAMTPEEKAARRAALQPRPRTSGLLQSSTPGRPVTQEMQIPSARNPRTDFSSREDARRGYFDTLTDDELVAEIGRLEDVRASAIRGRSKLSPQDLEANRFDLKIAVEQQKERGAIQRAQGREAAERIAPRTPGQKKTPRVIQHEQFGEVTEAADQKGIGRGKLRVTDTNGAEHIIQNPRTKGNRVAAFVKAKETPSLGARGPAVDRPIAMEAPRKPSTPRPQTQFEGESAEYTGKKDRYKRQAVYEIEMTEGASKGQRRWIQTAPPKAEVASPGNQFVRKMLEIKPAARSGAPVSITELRKQFPRLSKEQFDVEMSRLADEDKIALHRHDYPTSLSEAERNNLVKIGDKYFIAATIPEGRGHIMGMGLGSLQGMFKGRKTPKSNPTTADIEGASLGKAIGNILRTGAQGIRTVKTAFDLSAPLGQATFLTIPHPLKSARSFGQMLRSLSRAQSDAIDAEIAFHPLRKLGEEAGLYLATSAKLKGDASGGEEAFMVRGLNRVPGIGASERTYRTYLDTLRMSVWEGYVKSLQADGHTWESNPKAYRDAAAGINIASGRGSIKKGGKIEKAMDLGGDILFSPRNFVAKFQRLDPVRYAALAPGARKLVLRDALTTFGVMLGTAAMLKARGANVSLNPEDDNFMMARLGDTRYDLTVGAKTQVQFLARMAMGIYRKQTGEGNLPYKDPISVASNFMRNQLAPGLSLAIDAVKGEDFKGEKFSDKSAGKIAREAIAPMMVEDFYEAYEKEGKAGVAKTLPAILGARVNTYPDKAKADWVNTPPEMRAEQKKSDETRTFLSPKRGEAGNKADDETPSQFATRKAVVDEWTTKYGKDLVGSQAYKSATAEEQRAARDYLERTITGQSDEKRPSLYLLNPASILATVRGSIRDKKRKAARALM